jgi:hypothetical protein
MEYFNNFANWSNEWYTYLTNKNNTNDINKNTNKNSNKNTCRNGNRNGNKYVKEKIPKALREQVWINKMGKTFHGICSISWCSNDMTCFNFDCGHNIPESKGGKTDIENLIPICRNCNTGMGNKYTIDEWNKKYKIPSKWYFLYLK